jgi:hypothetical protein
MIKYRAGDVKIEKGDTVSRRENGPTRVADDITTTPRGGQQVTFTEGGSYCFEADDEVWLDRTDQSKREERAAAPTPPARKARASDGAKRSKKAGTGKVWYVTTWRWLIAEYPNPTSRTRNGPTREPGTLLPNAKHVAGTLANHMDNQTGEASPALDTLVHETGLSLSTVKAALRDLESEGLLFKKRRWNNSNEYRALMGDG